MGKHKELTFDGAVKLAHGAAGHKMSPPANTAIIELVLDPSGLWRVRWIVNDPTIHGTIYEEALN